MALRQPPSKGNPPGGAACTSAQSTATHRTEKVDKGGISIRSDAPTVVEVVDALTAVPRYPPQRRRWWPLFIRPDAFVREKAVNPGGHDDVPNSFLLPLPTLAKEIP